jgi:hypothetical protein
VTVEEMHQVSPAISTLLFGSSERSYSTRVGEKTTKTDAVKHVPVHPMLAAMLAEWKLGGWAEMMGRAPGPDDLIVPLPQMPPSAAPSARASRSGPPTTRASAGGRTTYPRCKADALDDAPIAESRGLRLVDGASSAVQRSGVKRDAAEPLQVVADPIAVELEAALALRRSGADPRALRRGLHWIEELLDE